MPDVAPPPVLAAGHVTFGYFGRPERLNDRVVAVWSRILAETPGSRLMLNSHPFIESAFRALWAERFAAHGIAPERIAMVFTRPQPATWEAYGQIDIALDPFPHNAGTTTIEALWQGVPVVTRADRPPVGRFGASILGAVGMSELIAQDDDAYVAAAMGLAADRDRLVSLRAELRPRVAESPLCDAAGLARAMEAAWRTLWREWCGRGALPVAAE
jgi:predicted O-linked N-acetylglucosamine transferase (SPINDLY family)